MEAVKMLDDPDHINTFLLMIGASPIIPEGERTAKNDERRGPHNCHKEAISANRNEEKKNLASNENAVAEPLDIEPSKQSIGTVTPDARSRAHSTISSPAIGTKAPPPTPVYKDIAAEAAVKLDSIEEDEADVLAKLAEESKLGLDDSKFALQSALRYPVAEYKPGFLSSSSYRQRTSDGAEIAASIFTPKTKNCIVIDNPPKGYMERVVSQFQKDDVALEQQCHPEQQISATASSPAQTPLAPANSEDEPANSEDEPASSEDEPATAVKPIKKVSQDVKTEADMSPSKAQQGVAWTEMPQSAGEDEEDHEYLTCFKSWGKPEARNKPAARVRRITLSNLPTDADLTLVQSLVYGGVIEDILFIRASGVAYIRFTSSDACDKYCGTYPNGLMFKIRGRSHTVFVNKCKGVDVVSGMLQAYIDCGATRCVRAIGADEDWGMGALKKLAEGKSRQGKVENIMDVYRNGIRTIVFRFTSIGDAVSFKGMLVRDEDWETCNIQFATDPCEKAGDVHLE